MPERELTAEEQKELHRSFLKTLKNIISYYENSGKQLDPIIISRTHLEYVYTTPLGEIIYVCAKKIY